MWISVTVSRDSHKFPKRCLRCRREAALTWKTIGATDDYSRRESLFSREVPEIGVLVPFCKRCASVESKIRLLRILVVVLALAAGLIISGRIFPTHPIGFSIHYFWKSEMILLAFAIPAALFWYSFSRVVRAVSNEPGTITFSFKNREYAQEFMRANEQDAVLHETLVLVDGRTVPCFSVSILKNFSAFLMIAGPQM